MSCLIGHRKKPKKNQSRRCAGLVFFVFSFALLLVDANKNTPKSS
jgi:hypothetical protein